MKQLVRTIAYCIAALLMATSAWSASLTFDLSEVAFNPNCSEVLMAGCNPIAVGSNLVLPGKTLLIPLRETETTSAVRAVVTGSRPIESGCGPVIVQHIPTGESVAPMGSTEIPGGETQFGTEAVLVDGAVSYGPNRYVRITVFPVVTDGDGQLIFNSEIDIYIRNRIIAPDGFISPGRLRSNFSPTRTENQNSAVASDGGEKYAIVTSHTLAPAAQSLSRYKQTLGYSTVVIFIEDIVTSYDGRDDAEKLREALRAFYSDGGKFVLLVGDETILPCRYAYPNATNSVPSLELQMICDLYFADLTGEWDADNDGVWGERTHDEADLDAELWVGRLPFETVTEVEAYLAKLIAYETNPGPDPSYLSRAFFFSSDQMRDYSEGGQHGRVAAAYPSWFEIDTVLGVEASTGDDPIPVNLTAAQLIDTLKSGYGIVNILAHGRSDAFGVRTAGYNDWPKSYLQTTDTSGGHASVAQLANSGRSAFYYSIACDNGAFDKDQPPFNQPNPNLAQQLLSVESGGAVAIVANSRWGWVGCSYRLQKAFFDSMFAHPDLPTVEAMYDSKAVNYYYRDLVFGQNFYGDPSLRIYSQTPGILALTTSADGQIDKMLITRDGVTRDGEPIADCRVVVCDSTGILGEYLSDQNGVIQLDFEPELGTHYTVSAMKSGSATCQIVWTPSLATNITDDTKNMPRIFALHQNYPNPFNPETAIAFDLERTTKVTLTVYNTLGQQVCVLADGEFPSGSHTVKWSGNDGHGSECASGVYVYRLETGTRATSHKMLLLK